MTACGWLSRQTNKTDTASLRITDKLKKLIAIILLVNLQSAICGVRSFAQSLDSAEYFFDTDPGIDSGTAMVVTPGDTVFDSVFVSTTGLAPGFHNLFLRVRDTNRVWSLYEGGRFYLDDTLSNTIPASYPIEAAEYFYDTDPGIDSGIAITAFAMGDTVIVNDTLPTAPLGIGAHRLYVRVRDTMNTWSLYEGGTFVICNLAPVADFLADTVCLYSSTTFIDLTSNLDSNYTYSWDFNNDHITDDTTKGNTNYLFSSSGTHTVSLVVDNTGGCTDTIVKTVYVDSLPVTTLVLTIDTICNDDTIVLAGGSPAGGVYSGAGVYGGSYYADSVPSGTHFIVYTYYNSDSCSSSATDKLYVSKCTGIHEYPQSGISASIQPSPFRETAWIRIQTARSGPLGFTLFDVFGKEVKNLTLESENTRLDREGLPDGIYFYKVTGKNGNYVSGKLVIAD